MTIVAGLTGVFPYQLKTAARRERGKADRAEKKYAAGIRGGRESSLTQKPVEAKITVSKESKSPSRALIEENEGGDQP